METKEILRNLVQQENDLRKNQKDAITEYLKEKKSVFLEETETDDDGEMCFADGAYPEEIENYVYLRIFGHYWESYDDVRIFGIKYLDEFDEVVLFGINNDNEISEYDFGDVDENDYGKILTLLIDGE